MRNTTCNCIGRDCLSGQSFWCTHKYMRLLPVQIIRVHSTVITANFDDFDAHDYSFLSFLSQPNNTQCSYARVSSCVKHAFPNIPKLIDDLSAWCVMWVTHQLFIWFNKDNSEQTQYTSPIKCQCTDNRYDVRYTHSIKILHQYDI